MQCPKQLKEDSVLHQCTLPDQEHHQQLPEAPSPAAVKVGNCHMGVPVTYSSMSIEKNEWLDVGTLPSQM
jgi:hypothetical protein